MKKTILLAGLAILLAATPLMAQMMGGGQMMGNQNPGETQQIMQQQERQPTVPADEQNNPQHMTPCMLGSYGYGMGPGMMGGGYGYGMGMMGGGYGYGMGMMGDYGYGMGPGMMGGYGHGMEPCMMGYYTPEQYEKHYRENQTFLDATKELRKKLHTLKFDYAEARRNPATKREDLEKMNAEMENLWKQIYEKRKSLSE